MRLQWAYPAKRWVFSGPTSYGMESAGWYWEKKGQTRREVDTNCRKVVQESEQNLVWFETTGPVKSSVESWRCWCVVGIKKIKKEKNIFYILKFLYFHMCIFLYLYIIIFLHFYVLIFLYFYVIIFLYF